MRQLAIVLPCYNPLSNWAENIVQQINNLNWLLSGTEIFVYLVNDGSTQGIHLADLELLTASLKNFHYIGYASNQGKGQALRQGVELANQEICIFTDVDFPYEMDSFLKIYEYLISEEYDIVAGVRDKSYYQEMRGARAPLSKILKILNSKIFRLPINDTQCGLKGFNRRGRQIFLRTVIKRYLFDLEFIFMAAKDLSIKFKAVPVTLRPGISFRKFDTKILITESTSFLKLFLQEHLKI